MNIYLIEQEENQGYDTFDSAVVVAENEDIAKRINPHDGSVTHDFYQKFLDSGYWCTDIKHVQCTLIGKAEDNIKQGVILSSYNAG